MTEIQSRKNLIVPRVFGPETKFVPRTMLRAIIRNIIMQLKASNLVGGY